MLPGFDAYVYVAMAERPSVFTVAPWGRRILVPAVVHAMGLRNVVRGFRIVSFVSLVAAGGLLFLFLRRLGHAEWAALLGVLAFGLTPPTARAVETPFLVEPASILLLVAFLLAVESGWGWGTIALLSTLGTLAKDGALVLALVPALVITRWPEGRREVLTSALAAILPAAVLPPLWRWWWTPQIPVILAPWNLDLVRAGVSTLGRVWEPTALAALVGGLTPLAVLGALRPAGRAYLRRYGISLAILYGIAFLGWVNVPSREPVPLFGANFERLLLYSVPLMLPLGLVLIDRGAAGATETAIRPPSRAGGPALHMVTAGLTAAIVIATFALVDRYRRLDLQGSRDGPLVLAVCRETMRSAARLAAGEEVVFDPQTRRFAWGESDPAQIGRMRWFLREGWGARAHYGTGEVVMHDADASILWPVLDPVDAEIRIRMFSPVAETLALAVNGHPLGAWHSDAAAPEQAFRVPAALLFRGDNLVTVSSPEQGGGSRLRELRYRPLVAP